MDLGIADKVAIVTGGSRGLGREAAMSLAREGVRVCICARDPETLKQTVGELEAYGHPALGISGDVTQGDAPQRIFQETESTLGPVDILVNNVGGRAGDHSHGNQRGPVPRGLPSQPVQRNPVHEAGCARYEGARLGTDCQHQFHLRARVWGLGGLHGSEGRSHSDDEAHGVGIGQGRGAGKLRSPRVHTASGEFVGNGLPRSSRQRQCRSSSRATCQWDALAGPNPSATLLPFLLLSVPAW